jgi:hypothetical protein
MLLNEIFGYAGSFVVVNGYTFDESPHAKLRYNERIKSYNIKLSDIENMFKQLIRRVERLDKNDVSTKNIFLYSKSLMLPIVLQRTGNKEFIIKTYLFIGTDKKTKNAPPDTANIVLEHYGELSYIEVA